MSKLDKVYADLLSSTPKIITDVLKWHQYDDRYKLQLTKVLAPEIEEVLELTAYVGRTNRSYTLLYQSLPIRRYDAQGRHVTPDKQVVLGPHKHIWDLVHKDNYAYVPTDIDPNADPNIQLFQFLREQNISVLSNYQTRMF